LIVPPIVLSPLATVVADVMAWAAIHAGSGYVAHRVPVGRLRRDVGVLRIHPGERARYERLGIRRWKDGVPEAGGLFAGGVSKRRLTTRDRDGLRRFAAETRRAELAHWLAAAGGPLFVVWNPPVIAVVMVVYGIAVNAPFIVIQRYNRARVLRALSRTTTSSSPAPGARG
jgi:glycosyl-4,4'-diaponeurosporenoate acyltransferase